MNAAPDLCLQRWLVGSRPLREPAVPHYQDDRIAAILLPPVTLSAGAGSSWNQDQTRPRVRRILCVRDSVQSLTG